MAGDVICTSYLALTSFVCALGQWYCGDPQDHRYGNLGGEVEGASSGRQEWHLSGRQIMQNLSGNGPFAGLGFLALDAACADPGITLSSHLYPARNKQAADAASNFYHVVVPPRMTAIGGRFGDHRSHW